MNLGVLIETVQRNCDIADARHARDLTLCTYLLEMREFYRWEHDLPPDVSPAKEDLGRWIREREARWEGLAEEEFAALPVAGAAVEPFAVPAVNAALDGAGLAYGAGIGRFRKPHFFLGRLLRRERRDGLAVSVIGCEYARDITAIPAALQDGTVVVRQEALRQWLREKVESWSLKQPQGPTGRAVAAYGGDAAAFERMVAAETETLILHEQGEHAVGRLLGPAWEEMLAGFRGRRAELVGRAVRDNWADCLCTLPTLLEREAWPSLHWWFGNFDGWRLSLFPSLAAAYGAWADGGDAGPLQAALGRGLEHWPAVARRLLAATEGDIEALAGAPELIRL
ncbi:MAG TPA: hypothetical protein VMB75_05705 [Rhodocyclaceae bacterium]|nr:hypothetical protein [Rhodocyclaceae bacterium]